MSTTPPRTDYEGDFSPKGEAAYATSIFAGSLLVIVAVFQIMQGIAAIAEDTVFVHGLNYSYEFDVTTWGWIHLIVGLVALGTGIGIVMQQTWGRILGIFVAAVSTFSNFAFLPYYPFWSLTVIAIDVLIIWALCRQIGHDRP
jgi:hypothetical protein